MLTGGLGLTAPLTVILSPCFPRCLHIFFKKRNVNTMLVQKCNLEMLMILIYILFCLLSWCSAMNELVDKFNIAYDRHSRRGGRTAFM